MKRNSLIFQHVAHMSPPSRGRELKLDVAGMNPPTGTSRPPRGGVS